MEPILKDSVGRSHRLAVGSNEAPQRSDLVKNDNDLEWLPELANLRESDVLATICELVFQRYRSSSLLNQH